MTLFDEDTNTVEADDTNRASNLRQCDNACGATCDQIWNQHKWRHLTAKILNIARRIKDPEIDSTVAKFVMQKET